MPVYCNIQRRKRSKMQQMKDTKQQANKEKGEKQREEKTKKGKEGTEEKKSDQRREPRNQMSPENITHCLKYPPRTVTLISYMLNRQNVLIGNSQVIRWTFYEDRLPRLIAPCGSLTDTLTI